MATSNSSGSPKHLTRILIYSFFTALGPALPMAVSITLVRWFACKIYWETTDPSQIPIPGGPMCKIRLVDSKSSAIITFLAVVDSCVGLLSSSPIQMLAERFGRKPLLVGLALCGCLSGLFMVSAQWADSMATIGILVLLSTFSLTLATKSTQFMPGLLVSDVTTPEQRTTSFVKVSAVTGGGMGVAFLFGSVIARFTTDDFVLPFLASISMFAAAALYALFFLPETKKASPPANPPVDSSSTSVAEVAVNRTKTFLTRILAPVAPLILLWPTKREGKRGRDWNLFLLAVSCLVMGSTAGFLPTATILFLAMKFDFGQEQNGLFLAWLVGSKFLFLLMLPSILRVGRTFIHNWQVKHPARVVVGEGPLSNERTPLLVGEASALSAFHTGEHEVDISIVEDPAALANHFDVILLAASLWLEALGYAFLYLSSTWQQVVAAFGFLALCAGTTACLKSLFIASVEPSKASASLAALDIVQSAALIVSPLVMGSLYSIFIKAGRPELLFLVAAAVLAFIPLLFIPLRRV